MPFDTSNFLSCNFNFEKSLLLYVFRIRPSLRTWMDCDLLSNWSKTKCRICYLVGRSLFHTYHALHMERFGLLFVFRNFFTGMIFSVFFRAFSYHCKNWKTENLGRSKHTRFIRSFFSSEVIEVILRNSKSPFAYIVSVQILFNWESVEQPRCPVSSCARGRIWRSIWNPKFFFTNIHFWSFPLENYLFDCIYSLRREKPAICKLCESAGKPRFKLL